MPKAVVFADIPLPPAGSAQGFFFPWESLVKVTRQPTVQKIALNVSFMDDNHPEAAALYHHLRRRLSISPAGLDFANTVAPTSS